MYIPHDDQLVESRLANKRYFDETFGFGKNNIDVNMYIFFNFSLMTGITFVANEVRNINALHCAFLGN